MLFLISLLPLLRPPLVAVKLLRWLLLLVCASLDTFDVLVVELDILDRLLDTLLVVVVVLGLSSRLPILLPAKNVKYINDLALQNKGFVNR